MFCLYVCTCTICMPGACGGQKRASDTLKQEFWMDAREPLCECWEQNSGPLQDTKCSFLLLSLLSTWMELNYLFP